MKTIVRKSSFRFQRNNYRKAAKIELHNNDEKTAHKDGEKINKAEGRYKTSQFQNINLKLLKTLIKYDVGNITDRKNV